MIEVLRTVTELPVADIIVGARLRPVSDAGVETLLMVIPRFGFTVPVLVRKTKNGFTLVDGAHRLVSMKKLGHERIAVVAISCTNYEARSLEASQNLAGASMSPLDDAIFIAAFGDAYQRLHPETTRGLAGALAKNGVANELSSFAEVLAEKRSITPRQVQKIAAAGRRISRTEADALRQAPRKVTLKDIETIGRIGDAEERDAVIMRLAVGNAKSAAEARRTLKAEAGGEQPLQDPVEAAFIALSKLWSRTGKEAKRRFVAEAEPQLANLLAQVRDARVINEKLGLEARDAKGFGILDVRARRDGAET